MTTQPGFATGIRGLGTLLASLAGLAAIAPRVAYGRRVAPVTNLFVSPAGDDAAAGDAAHPLRTLERAQAAVRAANGHGDVVVTLADGVYPLSRPWVFTAADGGQNFCKVTWKAARGAHPVISGGIPVTGWTLFDAAKRIYVAATPKGLDARQLWVNGALAARTAVEIPRSEVTFTETGLTIENSVVGALAGSGESRVEVYATGFFTARYARVQSIRGRTLTMQQPGWGNNLWGWDTLPYPFHPETSHLYLENSLKLLTRPGQWYLDPEAGRLFYRPRDGEEMAKAEVVLPRLEILVSIAGTLERPLRDLEFTGLQFSYSSWLGPSSAEGYADQQSGTFLTGRAPAFPKNVLQVNQTGGCYEYETVRNQWNQTPAAVQVAMAEHVVFDGDVFAHLGQYALGIGNDADANLSGQQLGTADITVSRNVFTDLAGGAIESGGVRPDAHHPSDGRLTNAQLVVVNNLIRNVSRDYQDNAAILSTYVWDEVISHNDISDAPYDAISVGWGWGYVDAGGSQTYRKNLRGYDLGNPVYSTPTTHRDVFVGFNRIYRVKQLFSDGGAIYNLGACPGGVIAENHIFDIGERIALYLDEGSRYVTVRDNVVEGGSRWLNINTTGGALPLRVSLDNTASGNWHDGTGIGGIWNAYHNDLIRDDHRVTDGQWPEAARQIMANAGIEPSAGTVAFGTIRPAAKDPRLPKPASPDMVKATDLLPKNR